MNQTNNGNAWEILLVEDNHGDVVLVQEALTMSGIMFNLKIMTNGRAALEYLNSKDEYYNFVLPDLIILDLNLPLVNGLDVLREIKKDSRLEVIPVVILTSSEAETDIYLSYKLKANSYVTKPVEFDEFMNVVNNINSYWLSLVKLPPKAS